MVTVHGVGESYLLSPRYDDQHLPARVEICPEALDNVVSEYSSILNDLTRLTSEFPSRLCVGLEGRGRGRRGASSPRILRTYSAPVTPPVSPRVHTLPVSLCVPTLEHVAVKLEHAPTEQVGSSNQMLKDDTNVPVKRAIESEVSLVLDSLLSKQKNMLYSFSFILNEIKEECMLELKEARLELKETRFPSEGSPSQLIPCQRELSPAVRSLGSSASLRSRTSFRSRMLNHSGSIESLKSSSRSSLGKGTKFGATRLAFHKDYVNGGLEDVVESPSEQNFCGTESRRFDTDTVRKSTLVHQRVDGSQISAEGLERFRLPESRRCKLTCVRSPSFDAVCGVIIVLNAIVVGIETEYMAQEGSPPKAIDYLQLTFNIWYMIELILRLVSFRHEFWCGEEWKWNVFDLMLVTSAVVDLLLTNIDISNLKTARILRVIRLFRVVRTLRIMRSLKYVREFRKMVYSLMSSVQTLVWSLLTVMGIIYIFALWLTQSAASLRNGDEVTHESDADHLVSINRYYSSMTQTMYSLFAAISGGLNWHVLVDPWISLDFPLAAAGFFTYISASVFGLLNIVTSVFVESAMHATKHFQDLLVDAKKKEMEMYTYHIQRIFMEIDVGNAGEISFSTMKSCLVDKSSELPQYLEALGISSSDVWVLFRLLDNDGSGKIDIAEFCEGCMKLKGEAKSFDVNCMIFESRAMIKYQSEFMMFVEEQFEVMQDHYARFGSEIVALRQEQPKPVINKQGVDSCTHRAGVNDRTEKSRG